MSNSHTPGPWRTNTDRVNGHGGWSVETDDNHIATVYADQYAYPEYEAEQMALLNRVSHANTRLIAAAPELLEALRSVLDDLGALTNRRELNKYMHSDCADKVWAAIDKATGADA